MKLQYKLLLVLSLLVVFPLTMMFFTSNYVFSSAFEEFARNRTDETLSVTMNYIDEHRVKVHSIGEMVASSQEFKEALRLSSESALLNFVERIREYVILADLDVYDSDGILLFSSRGTVERITTDDETLLIEKGLSLRKTETFVKGEGGLYMKSVHPVVSKDFKTLGVLMISYPMNDEFLDLLKIITNMHMILYDENGQTVATSFGDAGMLDLRFSVEDIVKKATLNSGRKSRQIIAREVRGAGYTIGLDYIRKDRNQVVGIIATIIPGDWFFTARSRVSHYLLSFTLGAILIAIILSFTISRSITTPVRKLAEWAMGIESGEPLHPVSVKSGDEVGELARVFNKMVAKLISTFENLEETNEELDAKLHETRVLFDVSQTINYIPDTQELLIKILDKTIDALGADHASIMLLNEETDSLQLKMVRGIDYDRKTKVTLKKGVGIAGLVLDRGEPLLISQGEDDPRFVVFTQDRNVRSMLCVPLLQSGKPFGVLNVVIRNSQNVKEKFTRLDLRLSTSIANQIALVIDKAKLYQASITDGMTGLYINNYFKARLREEVRRSRRYGMPLALIMCDIDHFKNFNDSWGHQMGDRVLCAFAEVIRIAVRDKLDIPARYGGEEFAVICPETTAEGALVLADRIRQIIEEKEFSEGGESISVTASFGVAISDETITEMDQLIKRADDALYQSKNAGRNQVTFWENKEPPTEILAIDSDKNPEDFT